MNPFSITGRIARLHYFLHSMVDSLFFLLVLIAPVFLTPAEISGEPNLSDTTILFMLLLFLAIFVSESCASIRRLHDLDRSGWQV